MKKDKQQKRASDISSARLTNSEMKAAMAAYSKICESLAPLTYEQRIRVVKATAIMLGWTTNKK